MRVRENVITPFFRSILPDELKENILKTSLDNGSLQSLSCVNKYFHQVSQAIRNDYLKSANLVEFMQHNGVTNSDHINAPYKELLMSNPENQLIPQNYIIKNLQALLLNNSRAYKVFSTTSAFCAVLDNGAVHTWGDPAYGGQQANIPADRQVKSVFSTWHAFCAVLDNGAVHT